MEPPWRRQVDRFCHQYLQLEANLDFPQDEYIRLDDVQDDVYKRVFSHEASNFGPPDRYRARILKELVSRIEFAIDDWDKYGVSDDIMITLSTLLATPLPPEAASAQKRSYVTYHLSLLDCGKRIKDVSQDPCITLLENRNLLSAGGTTGHRTWEAALHMGQYLCQNPSLVSGKHVLELGAGTGYSSILCVKHLQAAHVIASDGSDDVINNLADNLFLNDLQDSPRITPMDIKWGHALVGTEDAKWNGGRDVDVVLGADITYDRRAVPALVATLFDIFGLYPKVEVYISATERNAKTCQVFLDVCRERELSVEDLKFAVLPRSQQNGPFYHDDLAIRLHRVSRT